MTVDAGFARWLREGVLFAPANDAAIALRWGESARASEVRSGLATQAGAQAEAARQLAFLKEPIAVDEHLVPGSRADLLGRAVTISGDRLGYEAGADVFVIEVEELDTTAQTKLIVLRRLG